MISFTQPLHYSIDRTSIRKLGCGFLILDKKSEPILSLWLKKSGNFEAQE
jgi:hypothetical protein